MDVFRLIAAERRRLADALDGLPPDAWPRPSLCEGWSNHVVVAHLNAPWEVGLPGVGLALLRSMGNLDRAFDRISRDLAGRLDPAACITGLREHAEDRFTPPGSGPEAPLTDVIVHGGDILTPLGRTADVDTEALAVVLSWLAAGRAKGFLSRDRVAGLEFDATDVGLRRGGGPNRVDGPALAICGALLGRRAYLRQLEGPGVDVLAGRI